MAEFDNHVTLTTVLSIQEVTAIIYICSSKIMYVNSMVKSDTRTNKAETQGEPDERLQGQRARVQTHQVDSAVTATNTIHRALGQ